VGNKPGLNFWIWVPTLTKCWLPNRLSVSIASNEAGNLNFCMPAIAAAPTATENIERSPQFDCLQDWVNERRLNWTLFGKVCFGENSFVFSIAARDS
jgi:hypothetical protein